MINMADAMFYLRIIVGVGFVIWGLWYAYQYLTKRNGRFLAGGILFILAGISNLINILWY